MKSLFLLLSLAAALCGAQNAHAADLVSDSSRGWSSGMWRTYSFRSYGGRAKLELKAVNCNPMPMASMRVRLVHQRSGQIAYDGQTTYQGFQPACHHMHGIGQDIWLERGEYRAEITADNACGDDRRCTYNFSITDGDFGPGPGPGPAPINLVSDSTKSWSSGHWRTYNFRSHGGRAKLELSGVNCNPMPMASMRVRIVHQRSGQVSYEGQTTYQGFQPACHHMHKLAQDIRLHRGEYRLEVSADNACGDARRCSYNISLTDDGFGHGPRR